MRKEMLTGPGGRIDLNEHLTNGLVLRLRTI